MLELFHRFVSSHIDAGWCNGHIAIIQCPAVCICGLRFIVDIVSHHPPVVIATRMVALADLTLPGAHRHTTEFDTLEGWCFGEIDVQTNTCGQSVAQHTLYDVADIGFQRMEIGIGSVVAKRESHRGD